MICNIIRARLLSHSSFLRRHMLVRDYCNKSTTRVQSIVLFSSRRHRLATELRPHCSLRPTVGSDTVRLKCYRQCSMENIEVGLGSLRVRFQAAKLQAYFKAKTALSVKILGTVTWTLLVAAPILTLTHGRHTCQQSNVVSS